MTDLENIKQWFVEHVTLDNEPYTLDSDQARAVIDNHKNTLVTARAGSGKTRVIVAKVTYLVARCQVPLDHIAIFMFNRTAAAEVNQRIDSVKVDGKKLTTNQYPVRIASTFHKYALDVVKAADEKPEIIDEEQQTKLIQNSLNVALESFKYKIPPNEKRELLNIVSGFITRAGQKYPGHAGLTELHHATRQVLATLADPKLCLYHQISYRAYATYLMQIQPPVTDFNLLMHRATEILTQVTGHPITPQHKFHYIRRLEYIMIDEYQDFSYLFFALTNAIRQLAPQAHLFAVGDDWQAINRFAGSDVDYFLNFQNYFPEDTTNIPLATNYRSARRIVQQANDYMLKNYNPNAIRATPFHKKAGHIHQVSLQKVKYRLDDYFEDALGDGRFIKTLLDVLNKNDIPITPNVKNLKALSPAAKLLKALLKIIAKHRHSEIMLLHRHNFTSTPNITLPILLSALKQLVVTEKIMSEENFTKQVRCMTMHKSKGLESKVVILLEMDVDIVKSHHPHSTIFGIFGDTLETESADQNRLLYVALTRAKEHLYIVSSNKKSSPL